MRVAPSRIVLRAGSRRACDAALLVLKRGGVVVPTDTVYGIAGDALRPMVIRKIRQLKGHRARKPFPWLVADFVMAQRYAQFSPGARVLARRVWPGAVTLVLPRRGARGSLGLRIPAHPWLRKLIAAFGRPVVGTSANRSGLLPAKTARAASRMLSDADLIVDGGPCRRMPSQVLDCTTFPPRILRRGERLRKSSL